MGEKIGHVTFTLINDPELPVKILLTMPDGRDLDLQPVGQVTRHEARVICGGIMNAMRAGIRSDQFRHGTVLREDVRPPHPGAPSNGRA